MIETRGCSRLAPSVLLERIFMNVEQQKAAQRLKMALDKCNAAGLQGGVYSGNMCVWPVDARSPHHYADDNHDPRDFFDGVELSGKIISTKMHLDGGAGN